MKTVGQILRQQREKLGLSIKDLSHHTKIDSIYIEALEADNHALLPSITFAKGFIRNLSNRLDLNGNELVAIFRRDYRPGIRLPAKKSFSQYPFFNKLLPTLLPILIAVFIFLFYLAFQFRAVITPPKLSLSQPGDKAVLVSPITIEGSSAVDATISINGNISIRPDPSGIFYTQISLPSGTQKVTITATNRFGRSYTIQKVITILNQ